MTKISVLADKDHCGDELLIVNPGFDFGLNYVFLSIQEHHLLTTHTQ